jgi:L-ascorbate 6-phosphate lactonase
MPAGPYLQEQAIVASLDAEMETGGVMSSTLASAINSDKVGQDCLAIYWLSQAGFVFKSPSGKVVYIDPYFSDVVERMFGFKRMMPCPIPAADVQADLVICTHEHLDHMDIDALPILAASARVKFAGPVECVKEFNRIGLPPDRCVLLEEGKELRMEGIIVHPVFADHGELAPDALGIVVDMDGVKVYHTGDTAYRPAEFARAVQMHPHVLLPCINGRYGNLNAHEAALLTQLVSPQLAVASHFWMFVEHDGDPGGFLEDCSKLAPGVQAIVMKPGERILFHKGME